jgi:hypothetical protein
MTVNNNSGGDGGNSGLAFIVGGLVVVVGLGAFLYFGSGDRGGPSGSSTTTIERSVTPSGDSTTIKKD